ncbi:MAG: inositol monophosphatase [Cyclobacteriaceae bacterium]|nr:inositol monophosphatase [Cyclobacteriaceae bacterium]
MIALEKIGADAKVLVKEVGAFIKEQSGKFNIERIEEKGLNDLVSYVDKEAEQKLVNGLKKVLPEAGFITEEGTASFTNEVYKWIIDPLDGTTNFMHGLPVFSISVALLFEDELVLGIVYEINKDELFYAHKGGGAWLNDQKISVSSIAGLNRSLLATGFPYYNFDRLETYIEMLKHFMKHTHGLRRMGSAAVDLAYVACGRFEGFFEYNLNPWDVAGGAFIVKEAGGTVTDFKGEDNFLFGKSIVAAGDVTPELINAIDSIWNR